MRCAACDWTDTGTGSPRSRLTIIEAQLHHEATATAPGADDGHVVRVRWESELLIGRPQQRPRPPQDCAAHPAEDAPYGVVGCACARERAVKQTPMPDRTAPLESRSQLRRTGRLRPVSAKRAKENRQRAAMIDRLYPGRVAPCAVRAAGCTRWADDIHEPLSRARLGSITDEANQIPVCRSCHDVLTFTPESELGWAYEAGFLVHSSGTVS